MKRIRTYLPWLLPLAFFWIVVVVAWNASRGEPRDQAVMRYFAFDASEYVWAYTGPRPLPGEKLVHYARKGTRYAAEDITLVAYSAPNGQAPRGVPLVDFPANTPDFFSYAAAEVPDWPGGHTLFVGYRYRADGMKFWERGTWPSAPLEARGWRRNKATEAFQQSKLEEFGAVDVRIVSARAADRMRPEHRGMLLPTMFWFLLGGWGLVAVAGLFVVRGWRAIWLLWNAVLATMMWHAYSALDASQFFWTSFHIERVGHPPFWIGMALVQAILFPPLSPFWRCLGMRFFIPLTRAWRPWWGVLLAPPLLALAVACFAAINCRAAYGDATGALFSPFGFGNRHNPLSCALFYTYFHFREPVQAALEPIFGRNLALAGMPPEAIAAPPFLILFAPLYLIGIWGIAWTLGRTLRERLLLLVLLASTKSLITQFAYIEIYGPAVAILACALAILLRAHMRDRDVVWASAAAFLAYLFHFGAGPILPILGLLWARRWLAVRLRIRWILPRFCATAILAAAIWTTTLFLTFVYQYDGDVEKYIEFVDLGGLAWFKGPVSGPNDAPILFWDRMAPAHYYPLRSWQHTTNWIGGHLFGSGLVPFFLIVAVIAGARGWMRSWEAWGTVSCAILVTVLGYFIYNQFPYPRDWDLFVLPGLMQMTALAVLLARTRALPRRAARYAVAAMIVYQLWDTGLWLYYNLAWGPAIQQRHLMPF